MTDAHVHLRDWNQKSKETMLHGLSVACEAGFDHVFDMPNTSPAITTKETAQKRLEEAKKAAEGRKINYHLYLGLTNDKDQIKQMVEFYNKNFPLVCGLKMFASQSTGNMGIVERERQIEIYRTLAETGYTGVLAVHCEKQECFDENASCHSLVRPAISEIMSVSDQINAATVANFKGTLHIAHISTKGALDLVKQAKIDKRIKITCGATPHHILLNRKAESTFAKMNPPLREESDRMAIYEGLFDNSIDWVESDHAPHTLEDKKNGASGVPGFEGMLLTIKKLREDGMSEARLCELFCTNALKAFGMKCTSKKVPEVTQEMIDKAHKAYCFSIWS